jgi:hypothetical protein
MRAATAAKDVMEEAAWPSTKGQRLGVALLKSQPGPQAELDPRLGGNHTTEHMTLPSQIFRPVSGSLCM